MDNTEKNNDWKIKFGIIQGTIPSISLGLMIAGIILPTVIYSVNLKTPTPASLLVAICVSLFASVVYLWILDATGILTFRKEWISKSIYGAAITSVLGSSVAVYKDFFAEDKYPINGKWEISVIDETIGKSLSDNKLLVGYSKNSKVYYGYSDVVNNIDSSMVSNVEIVKLSDKENYILLKIGFKNGKVITMQRQFSLSDDKTQIFIDKDKKDVYKILISRPNN